MPGDWHPSTYRGWDIFESRLVAEAVEFVDPASKLSPVQPDEQGVQLRRGVQETRPERFEKRHRTGDDDFAGLVAGRLWALRPALHSYGLAQCGDVPHRRWPGRCSLRHAALCT